MLTLKNREKIANTFGQSCLSYDKNARLQRFSGALLCQYLGQLPHQVNDAGLSILDLGCGTGYFTEKLAQQRFTAITALDLSSDMIAFAKQRDYGDNAIQWVKGDAHALPMSSASNDIIFSNLVLQWTQPLSVALSEVYRVLKPGGHLIFSTLVDGTLAELKNAWANVDDDKHVIDYLSREQVESAWQQVGFDSRFAHKEAVELPYPSVRHLARELKHLGASLVKDKRQKGLVGKEKWKRMTTHYRAIEAGKTQTNPASEQIHATYQLYTACLTKPTS
ncbi:malonyl-ACP O-methyltransferase BioC [Thalassotalea litorea]|uniref:Malonyl-[acyl-carrier protein] O-methyltransferase n=1 Tax=Thalassotalea litorea TaxID=2020715 RepID=A0A5R9IW79_9GAMM|nr:malonyl-ACP O-methyltransferase BioC [Thalassotalea litorea]TLU66178.1 malonyl-ACP O-methyltransferase BioC [Thalassotalea litorea]